MRTISGLALGLLVVACSSSTTVSSRGSDTGGNAGAENTGAENTGGSGTAGGPGNGGDTAGGSGAPGECVPTGDEECFNGVDDDCSGFTDCADSVCDPLAECVPAGDQVGLLVEASDDCPEGFTEGELELFQNLVGGGCAGCSCSAGDTTCTAPVFIYESGSGSECTYDGPPYSGGTSVGVATFECTDEPVMSGIHEGWRVGPYEVIPGACTPFGTAEPEPASWGTSHKLCITDLVGGGCSQGRVCIPKRESPAPRCGATPGDDGCLVGTEETYYTDYDDTRSCGSCTCDRIGGDCDDVKVLLGSDWVCIGDETLDEGEQSCDGTPYSPPVQLIGTPTNPTCLPEVTASGALVPEGETTLCCG